MTTFISQLGDRLIARVTRRAPDFVIGKPGSPYIRRWWVIPRNRFFNIYLHEVLRDDDDRALHDHPWANCSIVLRGGYYEVTPRGRFWRNPGSVTFRRPRAAHRLELLRAGDGPANLLKTDHSVSSWSLFITGPRVRVWGFHCPKGWVPWFDFVAKGNAGEVGPGCGD